MLRIIIPVFVLLGLAKGAKRRKIINHLSGKTPEEARAVVRERAARRISDPAKVDALADRVVAKLSDRGLLTSA